MKELEAYEYREEKREEARMSEEQKVLEEMCGEDSVGSWLPGVRYPQPYSIRAPKWMNEFQKERYRQCEHNRLKHEARKKVVGHDHKVVDYLSVK